MEDKSKSVSKVNTSLAGEYLVLSKLTLKGYIATLTLGNTKQVDILATNAKSLNSYWIEVKTSVNRPANEKLFGENFYWIMHKKHEEINDPKLFYCFVNLFDENKPHFFIVPSKDVATYCRDQHTKWEKSIHKKQIKSRDENTMRKFRIDSTVPSIYEDNWSVLR